MRITATVVAIVVLAWTAPASAAETSYQPGSLIVPMDTDYQDSGMFEAYGLVRDLLKSGVPVDWIAAPGKGYGADDFRASATDVRTSAAITDHGYRGGPFVVDARYVATALPRVQAWQSSRPSVAVHQATAPFAAHVVRQLRNSPQVAVLLDGGEQDAFAYLNAAAIPMSDGRPWPADRDRSGAYACPGAYCCPDCLQTANVAGATTTSHSDGALFDANGVPRYCQIAAMDYPYPAQVPEVVAEVKAFLQFPVSFFAASAAVQAFENDPSGRFLTTRGLDSQGPSRTVDYYGSDDPSAQADGDFQNSGSGVAAFTLAAGSAYLDVSAVRVTKAGTPPGVNDVYVSGHVAADPAKGKVAYLGGQQYETTLPISARAKSQGTRYFLDSVFAAPCTSAEGAPSMSLWLSGGSSASNPYSLAVCYANAGPGIAADATLTLPLPTSVTATAAPGASISTSAVSWSLGSVPAGESVCKTVTLRFDAVGSYSFGAASSYRVGGDTVTTSAGSPLSVRFGAANLLRFAVSSMAPQTPSNAQIFTGRYPSDPTLDPVRDLEAASFVSGASFPHDASDASVASSPLVYYQVQGISGATLRVSKSGGRVVVTY